MTKVASLLVKEDGVEWLDLGKLTTTILIRENYSTIEKLTALCLCGILDIRGIGWDRMCSIVDQLKKYGFKPEGACSGKSTKNED